MEETADYGTPQKGKKDKKQIDLDFRSTHYRIPISFSKVPKNNLSESITEYELLIKNASKYSKSIGKFIKDCCLEPRIKVIEKQPLINEKLFQQLHKIGVNLNQISHKFNANFRQNEVPEAIKTIEDLQKNILEIKEEIKKLKAWLFGFLLIMV